MKIIRYDEFGGPEVLRVEEVPIPQAGPGQVLVRVEAAGLNFADTMQRRNAYPQPTPLPAYPGGEIAGTVEAVGEGVTTVAVGSSVMAVIAGGGYAEFAVAPAEAVFPVPPGLSNYQALAFQIQGLTAYLLLKEAAHLQTGKSVLVHSAAGGVGSLLVQLAKILGAGQVIATASSQEKLDLARSLGADTTVNYTTTDWPQQVKNASSGTGVDIVLDAVGGDIFRRSFECLASFGHIINYGNASGESSIVDVGQLLVPNQSVSGFYLGAYLGWPELLQEAYGVLFSNTARGTLTVHAEEVFPLEQAAEAHRRIEGRQTTGKVFLQPTRAR